MAAQKTTSTTEEVRVGFPFYNLKPGFLSRLTPFHKVHFSCCTRLQCSDYFRTPLTLCLFFSLVDLSLDRSPFELLTFGILETLVIYKCEVKYSNPFVTDLYLSFCWTDLKENSFIETYLPLLTLVSLTSTPDPSVNPLWILRFTPSDHPGPKQK